MDELVKYLRALVFLQVQTLSGGEAFQKPELLLSRAGLTAREIAEALGKNQAAVAKSIERAKKAARVVGTEPTTALQDEPASN
jgi:DNA-directed RNA polymerase specialized sigma24 family protein